MSKNTIRVVLFIVFTAAFVATVSATLWSYALQAGLIGTQPTTEDRYLGWMLGTVISELVTGIVLLWKDVFGLRGGPSSREFTALQTRVSKVERSFSEHAKSISDRVSKLEHQIPEIREARQARPQEVTCAHCGHSLGEIDASVPTQRDIACRTCLRYTSVGVDREGKLTATRK